MMQEPDTDSLIHRLTEAHRPVKHAMKPHQTFLGWCVMMGLYLGGCILIISPRPDLAEVMTRPGFLSEVILCLMTMIGSAYAASRQAYPDLANDRSLRGIALLPAIGFLMLEIVRLLQAIANYNFTLGNGMECAMHFCILSFLPAIILFVILARGFFIHSRAASCYAALASTTTGFLALRFVEPVDDISHIVIWHLMPFILMTIILGWVGSLWFSKRS